jgi:RNA polymerase sigma-70 factor (ECF subfamily)
VHDAALTAWRSFGQLREPARFDAWFTRILVNHCRDRLRARRRRPIVRSIPDAAGADAASMIGKRDEVARSLTVLEPDELIVVVLRFWQDLTIDQIANRLGVPSGTVKSRLHHALRRLQAALIAAETAS